MNTRNVVTGAILLLTTVALAEDAAPGHVVARLLAARGKLVAAGQNVVPGALGMRTYRVEELPVSPPVTLRIRNADIVVARAWTVALVGSNFPVRAIPPVIWAGGVAIGFAQESEDLSEVAVIVFDPALLVDGAALELSYGQDGERFVVPERLRFAAGVKP